MSEVKVNKISPRTNCGTVQLGDSGDTITIPSGATITNNGTQTGFGRTGTVNWITTKKTTAFTAANGEGYFVDTAASGAVTMTLPASPSAGSIVGVKDYNGNFATANLTIARNGSPINGGSTANVTISTAGASILLVYVDATQGWVATNDDESVFSGQSFISATGGTISNCGSCRIHTFTGPGTFCVASVSSVAANNQVSYVVVAGGGGSGRSYGGGGGAGGYREDKSPTTTYTASPLDGAGDITVTATGFPITIGSGGAKATPSSNATNGNPSTFSTLTASGGGSGGHFTPTAVAGNGGSGGGAYDGCASGGTGNSPSVSPPQGNNGGASSPPGASSGGGGAGAVGQGGGPGGAGSGDGGAGGAGVTSSIDGTATARAGGGGGFGVNSLGAGGSGGGGTGACAGTAGTANTGGGAGGAGATPNPGINSTGGSGIVIIRYRVQ